MKFHNNIILLYIYIYLNEALVAIIASNYFRFVLVVHVCGHCFNLTNLTESFSQDDVSRLEQRLSQLDDPWLNPVRKPGLVRFANNRLCGSIIEDLQRRGVGGNVEIKINNN